MTKIKRNDETSKFMSCQFAEVINRKRIPLYDPSMVLSKLNATLCERNIQCPESVVYLYHGPIVAYTLSSYVKHNSVNSTSFTRLFYELIQLLY